MDCVINPKTGRAVKKSSALGKRLLKNADKTLKEDCIINPKTGRAVKKSSKIGKKILAGMKPLRQSTQNFDEIEVVAEEEAEVIIPPAPPAPTNKPVKPKKIKPQTIFIAEETSTNKYSLDRRIKLYNKAKVYLNQISENECITRIKSGSKELMTLSNMLFMDKRIGSESVYGAIYLSSVKNVPDLSVVSKITPKTKNNLTELLIMEYLTEKLVKTKKTKHFPLLYTTHICPEAKEPLSLVSVNELCNGDLKMLINEPGVNTIKEEVMVNILYQILISITTFHNLGYLHRDTHWGNFLYQNNTEEGYYEYEYKGATFWLPACPYNFMLYDFGLSKKISKDPTKNPECIAEFMRPLYTFQPEKMAGWNEYIKPTAFNKKLTNIQKMLMMAYATKKHEEDVFIIMLKILDMEYDNMVYKTSLKSDDIILNDKPFIIA